MRKRVYRKRPEVERRIGMSIGEYIVQAGERGLSQQDMAEEIGVRPHTMGKWIEDEGFEKVSAYKRPQVAA